MKHRFLATVLTLLAAASASAAAQQSAASQSFVYNMKMGAGQGSGSMDFSLAVAIQSSAPDGTRTATIKMTAPKMPPVNGKQMDATISPSGAITIGSTGQMPANFSPKDAKAMQEAATGPMVQMMINPLSNFADGCARAPSQKAGTSWHASTSDTMTDVVYTITGREQRVGHDTLVVTMTSASSSGPAITGQGYYDPAAHLVIGLHSELKRTASDKAGQVLDVAIAP